MLALAQKNDKNKTIKPADYHSFLQSVADSGLLPT